MYIHLTVSCLLETFLQQCYSTRELTRYDTEAMQWARYDRLRYFKNRDGGLAADFRTGNEQLQK